MKELYVILINNDGLLFENKIFCPDLVTVREYLLDILKNSFETDNDTKFRIQMWTQNIDCTYSYAETVLSGKLSVFSSLAIK